MEKLLEYEGLVGSIIKRYSKYFDRDDLYQAGMMGLINASKNFDGEQGIKFSTYAYYYVLGEIKKYVRENGLIKVSRDLIKLNQSVEKAKEAMRQRLGREPTTTEVSLFLEIDEEKIEEASIATQDIKSLDSAYDTDSNEFYNSIKSYDPGMNVDVLDLRCEIDKLDSEEKDLIIARYYDDWTQKEVSDKLGISQVQVSRKEGKILKKLRQRL